MKKQEALDKLTEEILADGVCPDLAAQATQLVFGDGNPDADIVFIGEAPGKNEDEQGKPFVGAAGKFLNEMLSTIGLERGDVYITNIVKYRPPNNRDPLPEEKEVFLPFLMEQIKVIQPKLVITLGRHSMECFLPGLKISKVHGEPKRIRVKSQESRSKSSSKGETGIQNSEFGSQHGLVGGQDADGVQGAGEKRTEPYENTVKGVSQPATQQSAAKLGSASGFARRQDELVLVILPLYHPAAALYNGGMRQTLMDDFAKIPHILEKIK